MSGSNEAAQLLSEYLEENAEEIVDAWIDWLRDRIRTSTITSLSHKALRNHIPPILRELAKYLRDPESFQKQELLSHLRVHGRVRMNQGYSLQEVLAEFEGLSGVVTKSFDHLISDRVEELSVAEVLDTSKRLAGGLRSVSYIAMGTYSESHQTCDHAIAANLEEFANTISHEFRNPLNTISLCTQILKRSSQDNAVAYEQVEMIETAITRCTELLDTVRILMLAEGARAVDRTVSLDGALHRICQEMEPDCKRHGVEVRVAPDLPSVEAEAVLLYMALVNTIGNAIKYCDPSKDEKWVEISARLAEEDDPGFFHLAVVDNGLGVAAELIPRLREKGFRAKQNQADGTGRGLWLVDQALSARGGDLVIESTLGEGTRVTMAIPGRRTGSCIVAGEFRVEELMGESLEGSQRSWHAS